MNKTLLNGGLIMKWDFSSECDKNINDSANPCLTCIYFSSLGCQAKKEKKGGSNE